MVRKITNKSHLFGNRTCGSTAKAAILAGAMALALAPAAALAEPMQQLDPQPGQNQMVMCQPMQQEQGPTGAQQFESPEQMQRPEYSMPSQEQGQMWEMNGEEAPCPWQGEEQGSWQGGDLQPQQNGEQQVLPREGNQQPQPGDEQQTQQDAGQQPGGQQPQPSNDQQPEGQEPPEKPAGDNNGQQATKQGMGQNTGRPNNNPGDLLRCLIQKFAELFSLNVDEGKANELLAVFMPMTPGAQQPGAQQAGGQQPGQQPGSQPGGQSSAPTTYDAANNLTVNASNTTYASSLANQNAILVDGKQLSLSDVTVTKTGDATGEDADFYGINAGILANNGSTLTIADSDVTTNGAHANGVFSYGSGTTINISNSTIETTGNNSGGLMTTGGASMNAANLTVATSGNSSAAIRTDRGGGTVTATKGSYSTSGVGSPAIYSTADVTVSDATLSATNSEAVVIEGGNSVTLNNANVTGSNATLNGQSTVKTNVLIYQSMSGDASEGASSFNMAGGSLTSLTGAMFHVTNTTTTINLDGVLLVGAKDSNDFLTATADSWGTSGKNGGIATVNLSNQEVSGNIVVDGVSGVTLSIKDGSSYTGAIQNKGTAKVYLEAGSTWTLTGDSYVSSLDGDTSGINLNGHALYVNGVAFAA